MNPRMTGVNLTVKSTGAQTTYFFAALCAYTKLEMLKVSTHMNHSALKLSIYMQALSTAFEQLRLLKPVRLSKNPLLA